MIMYTEIEIRVTPEEACDKATVRDILAGKLGVAAERIVHEVVVRKSIDARQRRVMLQLRVAAKYGSAPERPDGFLWMQLGFWACLKSPVPRQMRRYWLPAESRKRISA